MYQARDPKTGWIVPATEASPYGDYVCPLCKKAVFLRRGNVRVAHFAHKSGLASPECELYVPSADIQNPWPTFPISHPAGEGRQGEQIAPLAFSIAIEPEQQVRRSHFRRWEFCITIPKSNDTHGQISFDCGGGVVRKIHLSSLGLAQQTYPADLDAADFGAVWVSPEVRHAYSAVVTRRLPGLSKNQITAFATTAQKYKPRVETLSWATNYYFVWRSSGGWLLPDQLPHHKLADHGAWCCALVSLPDEGDSEMLEWLHRATGLNVVREKRRWSIIHPVAYDVDIGGRIQVPPSNVLYLGTFPASEEDQPNSLECAAGDTRAAVVMRGGGWSFIEVTADESLQGCILKLNWDHHALPELARVPFPEARRPAVVLQFRPGTAGTSLQAGLHQASCRAALAKVRAGELEIAGLSLPPAVKGQLRWRAAGAFAHQSLALPDATAEHPSGADVALSAEFVSAINMNLKDSTLEIWLDFGPFGGFHAAADEPAARTVPELALRRETREQIVWFCKASGAYQTIAHQPLHHLNDEELVEHFVAVPAVPRLAAHKRSIERAIAGARGREGVT